MIDDIIFFQSYDFLIQMDTAAVAAPSYIYFDNNLEIFLTGSGVVENSSTGVSRSRIVNGV